MFPNVVTITSKMEAESGQNQFVTRVSKDTMEEESKKATEEAMKILATQMAKVPLPASSLEEECFAEDLNSDTETISESSLEDAKLAQKKRRRVVKTTTKQKNYNTFQESTKALETRIHYMKLDMVNTEVALSEANDKLLALQRKQNVFITIEEQFSNLRELISKGYEGNEYLTFQQIEHKYVLFICDTRVACQSLSFTLSSIEYPYMKLSLQHSLLDEKKNIQRVMNTMEWQMFKKRAIQITLTSSLILLIIILTLFLVAFATDTTPYWRRIF